MRVATNGSNGPVRIPPIPSCLPDPVRQQLRTIRDEVPPMSETAFKQLVDLLAEQHNENRDSIRSLELSVGKINGQVEVLMGAHNKRVDTKEKDVRKVRDKLLDVAVILLLGGLLASAVMYFRSPVPTPADPQAGVNKKIDELIEEMRTDRAARENEPAQTIKVPQRGKRRPPPGPQLGPGARYKNGDVIADRPALASLRIPIERLP